MKSPVQREITIFLCFSYGFPWKSSPSPAAFLRLEPRGTHFLAFSHRVGLQDGNRELRRMNMLDERMILIHLVI